MSFGQSPSELLSVKSTGMGTRPWERTLRTKIGLNQKRLTTFVHFRVIETALKSDPPLAGLDELLVRAYDEGRPNRRKA
jgi:hypothetical protein